MVVSAACALLVEVGMVWPRVEQLCDVEFVVAFLNAGRKTVDEFQRDIAQDFRTLFVFIAIIAKHADELSQWDCHVDFPSTAVR